MNSIYSYDDFELNYINEEIDKLKIEVDSFYSINENKTVDFIKRKIKELKLKLMKLIFKRKRLKQKENFKFDKKAKATREKYDKSISELEELIDSFEVRTIDNFKSKK